MGTSCGSSFGGWGLDGACSVKFCPDQQQQEESNEAFIRNAERVRSYFGNGFGGNSMLANNNQQTKMVAYCDSMGFSLVE